MKTSAAATADDTMPARNGVISSKTPAVALRKKLLCMRPTPTDCNAYTVGQVQQLCEMDGDENFFLINLSLSIVFFSIKVIWLNYGVRMQPSALSLSPRSMGPQRATEHGNALVPASGE